MDTNEDIFFFKHDRVEALDAAPRTGAFSQDKGAFVIDFVEFHGKKRGEEIVDYNLPKQFTYWCTKPHRLEVFHPKNDEWIDFMQRLAPTPITIPNNLGWLKVRIRPSAFPAHMFYFGNSPIDFHHNVDIGTSEYIGVDTRFDQSLTHTYTLDPFLPGKGLSVNAPPFSGVNRPTVVQAAVTVPIWPSNFAIQTLGLTAPITYQINRNSHDQGKTSLVMEIEANTRKVFDKFRFDEVIIVGLDAADRYKLEMW